MWEYNYTLSSDELYHYGVKGMKWGVRRYREKSGALTPEGKRRYSQDEVTSDISKTFRKSVQEADKRQAKAKKAVTKRDKINAKASKATAKYNKETYKVTSGRKDIDEDRMSKLGKKASNTQSKSAKATKNAYKAQKRSDKFLKAMEGAFKDVALSDIDPSVLADGRRYAYMLFDDRKRS